MTDETQQPEPSLNGWVEGALQLCARWNIVFVQLGAAYPRAREALVPRMDDVLSVTEYLAKPELGSALRLVTDLEALLEPDAPTLGQLRERVNADRDAGSRVILLSRSPRIAFPTVPGSQVLLDAKLLAPPCYSVGDHDGFGAEVTSEGVPIDIVLAEALRELGEVACAELDALVFQDGREEHDFRSIGEPVRDALLSSGLLVPETNGHSWNFADAATLIPAALADVIAGMRRPHIELGQISAHCWTAERALKQALRARAKALWGKAWAIELLGNERADEAFARASVAAYASAETVVELRDPLEWLSLAETLDVLENANVGNLGVNQAMWAVMRSELLPVKDRLERSQLIRKSDVDIALKWARLLTQKLTMSGSRSHADYIATAPKTQRELLDKLKNDLDENSAFAGDAEKDFMSLIHSTVRFVAHVSDVRPSYTAQWAKDEDAPLEREVQDAFKAFLDSRDLAGRSAVEVSSIGGGRADVVLYFNDGTRYVTEVKRDFKRTARSDLEAAYLPQTVSYQTTNVPLGQLLILDLTDRRQASSERLDQSIWVTHSRDADGVVISSNVIAVVRGNRPTPSGRKT